MKKNDYKKLLMSYTKEEIIHAILHNEWGSSVEWIIRNCYQQKSERLYNNYKKAAEEESTAFRAWMNYRTECIKKYGDGIKVKMTDLPAKTLAKWLDLQNDWEQKNAIHEKSRKALDNFYKEKAL